MSDTTLALPVDANAIDRAKAHAAIMAVLENEDALYTGGCRAFYTPDEWAVRGEEYGRNAVLIVVYDGGSLGQFFDYSHGCDGYMEMMAVALEKVGLYSECCTNWYSAIYRTNEVTA